MESRIYSVLPCTRLDDDRTLAQVKALASSQQSAQPAPDNSTQSPPSEEGSAQARQTGRMSSLRPGVIILPWSYEEEKRLLGAKRTKARKKRKQKPKATASKPPAKGAKAS